MKFEKLISLLIDTPSKNAKVDLIRENSDADIKSALWLAYDPFTMFFINKIDMPEPGKGSFSDTFPKFAIICDRLSRREITGNEARSVLTDFFAKCTKEAQSIYMKILQKDFKAGFSISTLQNAFGDDFIEEFTVQLANKYLEKINSKDVKKTPFYWESPKLNGLRCYYKNGALFTRNGHPIMGFDHIVNELAQLTSLNFIDGELYSPTVNFQKIQGAVMSNKNIDPERKRQIFYNVFVVGRSDYKSTEDMVKYMDFIDWSGFEFVRPVRYSKIDNDLEKIKAKCIEHMKAGYEGIMLRHPERWYEWKRSSALLKFKLFREEDFTIVDTFEGDKGTKYEGQLGGFIVEGTVPITEGSKEKAKVCSGVGSGFDEEDRAEFWKIRKSLIGKKVEVKFQGLTDDRISLQFPVYMKLKEDRN